MENAPVASQSSRSVRPRACAPWICLRRTRERPRTHPIVRRPSRSRLPIGGNAAEWYGNVDPSSIGYAFRPRLRDRLTLPGLTLDRKPWVYGEQVSHLFSRYLFRHNHFDIVQESFPSPGRCRSDYAGIITSTSSRSRFRLPSSYRRTLPYQRAGAQARTFRGFGSGLESRSLSARRCSTSKLLRTF